MKRYESLKIAAQQRTAATTVAVSATLSVVPGQERSDPSELTFQASESSLGPGAGGVLGLVDAGQYEGSFTAAGDGRWTLSVDESQVGVVGMAIVEVDSRAPVVTISIDAPPARRVTAQLSEIDPLDTAEGVVSHRRDEVAHLTVRSDDADLVPASVALFFGDAGVVLDEDCTPGRFCKRAHIDLAKAPMNAYRAQFPLVVQAADTLGNQTSRDAGVIPVTRYYWRRSFTTNYILEDPAIDAEGALWINAGTELFRLSQKGEVLAGPVGAERMVGPPIIGRRSGWVMIPRQAPAGGLVRWLQYDPNGASVGATCEQSNLSVKAVLADTLVSGDGSARDTLMSRSSNGIVINRPESATCRASGADPMGGNPVAQGARVFAVDSPSRSLNAFEYTGATTIDVQTWNLSLTDDVRDDVVVSNGSHLIFWTVGAMGQSAVLNAVPTATSTPTVVWSLPLPASSFGDLVVGQRGIYTSGSTLCRIPFGSTSTTPPCAATTIGATTIGEGDRLYATTNTGLAVLDAATLGVLWTTPPSVRFASRVTLDCNRRGGTLPVDGPGVLYGTDNQSSDALLAIFVDSHGLDRSAQWPKYAHDNFNTSNVATPIPACP